MTSISFYCTDIILNLAHNFMGGDSISQLTCLCTYWSKEDNRYKQLCFHFLTKRKSPRQDYFYALDVIIKKIDELDQFQPTRVVKISDGCAAENRSSHVLSHLVKTINHTVAYKVFKNNLYSLMTFSFQDHWSRQRQG